MKILVINCGSSSLKYQLIDSDTEAVLAKGLCERIGIEGGCLTHQSAGKEKVTLQREMPEHTVAVQMVIDTLTDKEHGVIASLDEIGAVGHRIVHGGEKFAGSVIVTDEVVQAIEECADLAPLHNPANLIGIRSCEKIMPNVPQAAVFDTAFHQTMPKKHICTGCRMSIMRNIKYAVTDFTGRVTILCRRAQRRFSERTEKICVSLCAISETEQVFPL